MNYVVETASGRVLGESAGPVSVWRGIPFAAPPVGDARGRAPQPVAPWSGVRDATRFGFIAPQDDQRTSGIMTKAGGPEQNEDCLNLNVWSPGAPSSVGGRPLRPVLVWFHGGANVSGASSLPDYDGASLSARGDLVVVTANYRLGALGFGDFSSFGRGAGRGAGRGVGRDGRSGLAGRDGFDSNLALRDAVAALEWVRANIGTFGGDPTRVTIMGESAGASMVTTLLATPAAAGLFRGAIAESPPVTTVYGRERSAARAREILDELGIEPAEVARLRDVPVSLIVQASSVVLTRNARERPGTLAFGQVVDGSYLPQHPLDAFETGRTHAVPLLIGTNDDESTLFKRADPPIVPTTVDLMLKTLENADAASRQRILDSYSRPHTSRAALDFGTNWTFRQPVLRAAAGHTIHSGSAANAGGDGQTRRNTPRAQTFVYQYGFASRIERLLGLGATHGSEIPLVFGTLGEPIGKVLGVLGPRRTIRRLSAEIQDAWIAFVRAGDPSTPGRPWAPHHEGRSVHRFTADGGHDMAELEPQKREAWSTLVWPR
jgi:para-nitrobenzyl esterase